MRKSSDLDLIHKHESTNSSK